METLLQPAVSNDFRRHRNKGSEKKRYLNSETSVKRQQVGEDKRQEEEGAGRMLSVLLAQIDQNIIIN